MMALSMMASDGMAPIRVLVLMVVLAGMGGVVAGNSQPVGVSVDLLSSHFAVGEPVNMTVRTDRDAWVYVFSTDARGTTRQIFPNGHHRDNHLRGARSVRLPSSGYSLVATGPEGDATISAFAITQRFDWLRPFDSVSPANAFPVRAMSPVQFRARLEESVAASRRALDVPRESVPARAAIMGHSATPVRLASAWRVYPSCGYVTRVIRVTRPAPAPRVAFHDGFAVSRSGSDTSFHFSSGRGSISSSTTIHGSSHFFINDPPIHHFPSRHPPGFFQFESACSHGLVSSCRSCHPSSIRPSNNRPARLVTTTLHSSPSGADVHIDGRHWGRTPLTVRLPPGTYDLRLERRGYEPECRTLHVREGRTESPRFRLQRERR